MRTRFLLGLLLGIVVGVAVGGAAFREYARPDPPRRAVKAAPSDTGWPRVSYAQQGEDILARGLFDSLGVAHPTYIDIGAYHPFVNNNTYLFFRTGSHGVLVEPNPAFTEPLRRGRPGDRVLPIGIGTTDATEADYYVLAGPGQDNTFSKAQADELVRQHGKAALERVIKVPLRTINRVLDETFPAGAPDFFSIDIEGMDLEVLQTLDFERHRPKVFCVETTAEGADHADARIAALMTAHGYAARGGNLVNTFFVDTRLPLR